MRFCCKAQKFYCLYAFFMFVILMLVQFSYPGIIHFYAFVFLCSLIFFACKYRRMAERRCGSVRATPSIGKGGYPDAHEGIQDMSTHLCAVSPIDFDIEKRYVRDGSHAMMAPRNMASASSICGGHTSKRYIFASLIQAFVSPLSHKGLHFAISAATWSLGRDVFAVSAVVRFF